MGSYLSQAYLSGNMELIFQGYKSINLHKNKNKAKQRNTLWRNALLLILFMDLNCGGLKMKQRPLPPQAHTHKKYIHPEINIKCLVTHIVDKFVILKKGGSWFRKSNWYHPCWSCLALWFVPGKAKASTPFLLNILACTWSPLYLYSFIVHTWEYSVLDKCVVRKPEADDEVEHKEFLLILSMFLFDLGGNYNTNWCSHFKQGIKSAWNIGFGKAICHIIIIS